MKTTIAFALLSVYTVLEVIAYTPQLIKLLRTKSADDLSCTSWITWFIADACYLGYVLLESPDIGVIFICLLDLAFIISVYCLTIYYQRNTKHKSHKIKRYKR